MTSTNFGRCFSIAQMWVTGVPSGTRPKVGARWRAPVGWATCVPHSNGFPMPGAGGVGCGLNAQTSVDPLPAMEADLWARGKSPFWQGKSLSRYEGLRGINKILSGSPQHVAWALVPVLFRGVGPSGEVCRAGVGKFIALMLA